MRKIFLSAMLCMALFSFTQCSTGLVIPEPVCEYGAMICETLTFLCSNPTSQLLSKADNDALMNELKEFHNSLQKYVHKVSEN
jgi:hypothetical protein